MSHKYPAIKNRHPKVYFEQYLYNAGEPWDDRSSDTPPELEAELLENSYFMRQKMRRIAHKLRNHYL